MIFKFKFPLGAKVFLVDDREICEYDECGLCSGEGQLKIEGFQLYERSAKCHECNGDGKWVSKTRRIWEVKSGSYTIGQARVELTDKKHCTNTDRNIIERYMCHETGIHSGTLHPAKKLFGTKQEALFWCEKENSRINWESTKKTRRRRK